VTTVNSGEDVRRGRTGVLLIRVWWESEPSVWRARITHRIDVSGPAETVTFAANPDDLHTVVSEWLRTFLDAEPMAGPPPPRDLRPRGRDGSDHHGGQGSVGAT
jgi:hypothetical protein